MGEVDDLLAIACHMYVDFEAVEFIVDTSLAYQFP